MRYGSPPGRKDIVLSKLKATPAGVRLDRFELIAELASGGMATVYLARLGGVAGFQRFVAIKRLHPHLAQESEFVDMFLDEARLAARLHHPNVVPIVEIGTSADGYYLVMEYIEGDTAARLLARSSQTGQKVPFAIGTRIVLDALTGLHAAHELQDDDNSPLCLVHRDVSPQNILVGVDGTSRITDFGVARAASRLSSTRSGQMKGKLAYMAPEQARGVTIDRRADIFAMGAVLWELLVGRRLFKGEGEAETLNRVLFEPIPWPRQFDSTVPVALEQICMCALHREQFERYASAADMADALERAARSLDMLASAREVAAYVDAVIGQEISQQRDTVRAWLAQSEPSRNARIGLPGNPALLRRGDGQSELSTQPERAVSTVSSTVIPLPKASGPSYATPPPAKAHASAPGAPPWARSSAWTLAVAMLLGVCVGAMLFFRWRAAAPPQATAAAVESPVAPVSVVEAADPPQAQGTASASDKLAGGVASVEAGSPAVTPAQAGVPTGSPHTQVGAPSLAGTAIAPFGLKSGSARTPKVGPSKSPQPPQAVPDDISHNPYR